MAIEIWTAEDLRNIDNYRVEDTKYVGSAGYAHSDHIRGYIDGDFIQMADIDLSAYENWVPIGGNNDNHDLYPFIGNYDGNGFSISNLKIDYTIIPDMGQYKGIFAMAGVKNSAIILMDDSGTPYVEWDYIPNKIQHASGVLKNINLVDVDMLVYGISGALVGMCYSSIINCHSSGVIRAVDYSGGLVGEIDEPRGDILERTRENATAIMVGCSSSCDVIFTDPRAVDNAWSLGGLVGHCACIYTADCHATGNVTSNSPEGYYLGGLAGTSSGYTISRDVGDVEYKLVYPNIIERCYATGNVSSAYCVGGLIGYCWNNSNLYDCYATGNVTGNYISAYYMESSVGGLVGSATEKWLINRVAPELRVDAEIVNCYSTGLVTLNGGVDFKGGLIGKYLTSQYDSRRMWYGPVVINSFYDAQTSEMSDNLGGGIPLSTEDMKNIESFDNWDFDTVWEIDADVNNGYPTLRFVPYSDAKYFSDGDGSESNPYLVSNPYDLNRVRNFLSSHFRQIKHIDISKVYSNWIPITDFSGVYDGDRYSIRNFNILSHTKRGLGLFGKISGGEIRDVHIRRGKIDSYVIHDDGACAGILAGICENAKIHMCTVDGAINVYGSGRVGGVVGLFNSGQVSDTWATVPIITYRNTLVPNRTLRCVGGFIGEVDSYIPGDFYYIENGNFIEPSQIPCILRRCSVKSVNFTHYARTDKSISVGGFVGKMSNCFVDECRVANQVYGSDEIGGFIGSLSSSYIKNSYSSGLVSFNSLREDVQDADGLIRKKMAGFIGCLYGGVKTENCYTSTLIPNFDDSIDYAIHEIDYSVSGFASPSVLGIEAIIINSYCGTDDTKPDYYAVSIRSEPDYYVPGVGTLRQPILMHDPAYYVGFDFDSVWEMSIVDKCPDIRFKNYDIFSGGDGSVENPYLVSSEYELDDVRFFNYCSFSQISDIDLSSFDNWEPIGSGGYHKSIWRLRISFGSTKREQISDFDGFNRVKCNFVRYNGNNHKIKNLRYMGEAVSVALFGGVGLFGSAIECDIENVGLEDVNIQITDVKSGDSVGSLIGFASASNIFGCYSTGKIEGTDCEYIGGIVGYMDVSSMSANTGDGRLVSIRDTWSSVDVFSKPSSVGSSGGRAYGGIVGFLEGWGSWSSDAEYEDFLEYPGGYHVVMYKCYSTGNIAPVLYSYNDDFYMESCGGLAGILLGGKVEQCYATGDVSGGGFVGGLVGQDGDGTFFLDCFSRGSVTKHPYIPNSSYYYEVDFGGFSGFTHSSAVLYMNCYTTSIVTDTGTPSSHGAFSAMSEEMNLYLSSYYDKDLTSLTDIGAVGKTSLEMRTQSTFDGWDFENVWGIDPYVNDGYPFFITRLDSTKEFKRKRAVYFKTNTGFKRMRM